MKNRLIIFLCFTLLGKCFQSFGQESLILNSNWNKKIKENHHLSPFYYGITKTKAQIEEDSNFVRNEILKFGNREKAFDAHYVKAWNYYNVGIIDTATIEFNRCFLIDKKNDKAITGLQYIIRYLNGLDINLSLNDLNKILDHLDSLLILREYNPLTYSLDILYIKELQKMHKENKKYDKLPPFNQKLQEPYSLDSNKYILVKMRFDDDEGYFKMGLKDGLWRRYRSNSSLVMFDYKMHYGIRHGKTRSYDKNGIIMVEFSHVNGNIEGERKYFDEKGELVRIAYWKNNQTFKKNDKVYKQVLVEGDIVREKDKNGKVKEYIIKDREKVPLE